MSMTEAQDPAEPVLGRPSRPFIRLLLLHSLARCLVYLLGVVVVAYLIRELEGVYTAKVLDEHMGTVVGYHLRMLLAYGLVGLLVTTLSYPVVARSPWIGVLRGERTGHRAWMKLILFALAIDLLLFVLSIGPFCSRNPAVLAGAARVVAGVAPAIDLHLLYRWRLLDLFSLGFCVWSLFAASFYLRRLRTATGWTRRGGVVLLAALLLGLLTFVVQQVSRDGGGEPGPDGPLNVLIIASDSLRSDHLGVHGYHRKEISPHIDAFARDAVDFTNMHVATASTLESWASFFTGRFPPSHGLRYMYVRKEDVGRARSASGLLPAEFSRRGYHTAVVSDWAGNCFNVVDMGFDTTMVSGSQNLDAFLMEATNLGHFTFPLYFSNSLGEWILPDIRRTTTHIRSASLRSRLSGEIRYATHRRSPFFGLIFFSTTHLPYRPDPSFRDRFVDPDYKGPHRYEIEVDLHQLITSGFDPELPAPVRAHIRDLYDATVAEFDDHVGRIIADLKERGLYDRTIIIVTSDHGEDLYDPGSTLGHGTNFFGGDQSTRIPFFIRVPGVTQPGHVVEAITRNVDLAPTLAALLGWPPEAGYEGVDLSPLLKGEATDLDLLAFAETCYLFFPKSKSMETLLTAAERQRLLAVAGARDTLEVDPDFDNSLVLKQRFHDPVIATKDRMVRSRRWKLISIPGKDQPILRLYDMKEDPTQSRNLADQQGALSERLSHALDAYWEGKGGSLRWPLSLEDPANHRRPAEGLSPPIAASGVGQAVEAH